MEVTNILVVPASEYVQLSIVCTSSVAPPSARYILRYIDLSCYNSHLLVIRIT